MIDRRNLLLSASAATAATLLPTLSFAAPKSTTAERTQKINGTFTPGAPDWYYLPIQVPPGVREIEVHYRYDKPSVHNGQYGNACDIGIFGPEGHGLGNRRGFRGWSGGFRDQFTINATEATPGYLAGPITPGRWHVILGPYTVAPQGMAYEVEVTLRFGPRDKPFRPNPAPTRAPARERGLAWYRGDNHLHTVHSDGRRTPEQLVAAARAAKLDFITSTEHNTCSAQLIWGEHAQDDLLILNGEEVTTRSGHWPAIGLPAGTWIDWRYRAADPADFRRFTRDVHAVGGLVVAAHPFANCFGCTYEFSYELADLVEIWNGPWDAADEAAVTTWDGLLRTGRFIPAIGNSDAHNPEHVVGLPQTVVRAAGLNRAALLDGLRRGRSYLTGSADVSVDFTVNGATIGETVRAESGAAIDVAVRVDGAPGTTITLFNQLGPVATATAGTLSWQTRPRYTRWVRAEVRRAHRSMVALTNPIFLR